MSLFSSGKKLGASLAIAAALAMAVSGCNGDGDSTKSVQSLGGTTVVAGPSLVGGVFMLVGVCDVLSRVVVLPRLLKIWDEQIVGSMGLAGLTVGLILLFISAFWPHAALVVAAVACIVLGEGLFDPSYNARLSMTVPEHKQGLLQGTNQSLQALYRVVVPLAAGAIYTYNHGSVFAIAAVSLGICLALEYVVGSVFAR
jgi:DHA1 family tetracycline resistance protein-like MFS transporter